MKTPQNLLLLFSVALTPVFKAQSAAAANPEVSIHTLNGFLNFQLATLNRIKTP